MDAVGRLVLVRNVDSSSTTIVYCFYNKSSLVSLEPYSSRSVTFYRFDKPVIEDMRLNTSRTHV